MQGFERAIGPRRHVFARERDGRAHVVTLTSVRSGVDARMPMGGVTWSMTFRSYLLATVETMPALVPDVLEWQADVPSALQRIRTGHRRPMITNLAAEDARTGRAINRRVKWRHVHDGYKTGDDAAQTSEASSVMP